ncbi:putative adhesin [Kribbella orskensis]|uniref:Adhesin n=2 Tax=Kribbellaceae TaxID=2726069 RepID=A0ABY2BQN2_9ACTN|nr:putative adhesin [Kribbella sp. VKM Ac-2500]TCO27938.1 putative adhesin [Kribbella orskensis]
MGRVGMADTKQVGALLLVTGAALAFWSFGDRESSGEHRVDSKISTVRLDSPNADITIKVGDGDTTTVQEKRKYWLIKHGDTYSVDGETLKLDGDCGWQCTADFVITVPRGTKVTGENGTGDLSITGVGGIDASSRSGDISLRDVTGDVKLDLTSGDVEIDRLTGKLDIVATSGDIDATRLKGGAVNVETTSGDLQLELDEQNDVRAKGTSSDVEVKAPAGDYKVHTETRSGDVENGLGNAPDGSHSIDASTVSGDVTLATR